MAFVIAPIRMPAVLKGQKNGQLPGSILVSTPGLAGGPVVRLVQPATRAWRAMCAAAQADGVVLQTTSLVDSYRPYDVQYRIFHERYTTQRNTDWNVKVCGGVTYYQRPGTATAACPGSSNHGLALANDIANASGKRLDWLLANAMRYGFSWELASEPWHLHYWAGDSIPAAVLAYEQGEDDMDAAQAKQLQDVSWSVGRGAPKMDGTGMQAITYWGAEVNAILKLIAEKVDLDPAELAAVAAAAREGAEQGAASSADEIAAAVVALLPEGALSKADVEAAVRGVFADAGAP